MRYQELDVFLLAEDLPEHGLLAGMPGTILLIHGDHAAYEVEFANSHGEAVFIGALAPHLLWPYQGGLMMHQGVLDAMPGWCG